MKFLKVSLALLLFFGGYGVASAAAPGVSSLTTRGTLASLNDTVTLQCPDGQSMATVYVPAGTLAGTVTVYTAPDNVPGYPGTFTAPFNITPANSSTYTQTLSAFPGELYVTLAGNHWVQAKLTTATSGASTATISCSASIARYGAATTTPSVGTGAGVNNYDIDQTGTPVAQPGNDWAQGYRISSNTNSPSLTMLSAGDYLSSESNTKGRIWMAQATGTTASAVVYIALTELQTANSLGPQAGDVLTITVNGHAVAYTVLAGDTTLATLAASIAAAINADSTDSAIVSAVGSSSGQLGTVTITALTSGICCRYSLSSSVSGGSQETLNSFPLLDVAGSYADYGKNVSGWSLGTDLGDYTFDHSGNFQGPVGHILNIQAGAGASTAIRFNFNSPGNYTGLAIYDGTSTLSHADLLYPMNVHIITGPLEENICQYIANNCTSAPTNPSYVGEWMNINGSATGPTQHEIHGHCVAGTTCTVNFTYNWTNSTSYDCTATAEGSADAPYISTKTAAQIVFTGSTSVVRDFICSGI